MPVPTVAAAINWFGVTDVNDVIDGPNRANAAMTWLEACRIVAKSQRGFLR